MPNSYPKVLKTIGDHIRAWRIKNNVTQSKLATLLRVSEDTIVGWEKNRNTPTFRQMPAITELLGYLPVKIDMSCVGGRVLQFRYLNGLSPKDFGRLINTDPSTVRSWENNTQFPSFKKLLVIEGII
ncbi:XRE family transcriptional regulator [Lacibacter luteus]|uniref:XRE family transcriptional regulator n=1 Tax=Lacibacter luteus TaxID=2508719 RepID=A0A4Q1CI47_9BACT|nr:XRE family transcriptional regulator [Lacibacter luteus]